jgi:hypothetical protein
MSFRSRPSTILVLVFVAVMAVLASTPASAALRPAIHHLSVAQVESVAAVHLGSVPTMSPKVSPSGSPEVSPESTPEASPEASADGSPEASPTSEALPGM